MGFDSSRIIIVSGLPRAGTSVMTYILATHKDISLFIEGHEIHVLENEILPLWTGTEEQHKKIQRILNTSQNKFVLLKRPELYSKKEETNFNKDFKDSIFVLMDRKFSDISKSWQTSSMIPSRIANEANDFYEDSKKQIQDFIKIYPEKRFLYTLEQLKNNPNSILEKISNLLGIQNKFDTNILKDKGKWDHNKYVKELLLSRIAFTDLTTNKQRTMIGLKGRIDLKKCNKIRTI
jgi:hypothetical protein